MRLLVVFALFVAPVAGAWTLTIDANLPDGGDCQAIGTWDPAELTCRAGDLTLAPGDVLTIESGRLVLAGDVINAGLIDSRDRLVFGAIPFGFQGTLHNLGTLLSGSAATLDVRSLVFANARTGRIVHTNSAPSSTATFDTRLDNAGEVELTRATLWEVTNRPTGIVRLGDGSLLWDTFRNEGELDVSGWWEVEGTLVNERDGRVVVRSGAVVNHRRTLVNHGLIEDFGIVGYFSPDGYAISIDNHGVYDNHGSLSDCAIGSFDNLGVLNNFGTVTLCATLTNLGTINNAGAIVEANPLYYLGAVDNAGTIAGCGTFDVPLNGAPVIPDVDFDDDDRCDTLDCDPADSSIWSRPGAVRQLRLAHDVVAAETTLSWAPTLFPGGTDTAQPFDVLRSTLPSDFVSAGTASCAATGLAEADWTETAEPAPNHVVFFLARSVNACGAGDDAEGRVTRDCP